LIWADSTWLQSNVPAPLLQTFVWNALTWRQADWRILYQSALWDDLDDGFLLCIRRKSPNATEAARQQCDTISTTSEVLSIGAITTTATATFPFITSCQHVAKLHPSHIRSRNSCSSWLSCPEFQSTYPCTLVLSISLSVCLSLSLSPFHTHTHTHTHTRTEATQTLPKQYHILKFVRRDDIRRVISLERSDEALLVRVVLIVVNEIRAIWERNRAAYSQNAPSCTSS